MSLYKPTNSTVWWSDLRSYGKRLRATTGETDKARAQVVHNQRQMVLWADVAAQNPTGSKSWADARSAWVSIERRSDSEIYSLSKFEERFNTSYLGNIDGFDVERALSFCKTAGTYMRYRTMIVAVLNLAVKKGWLAKVPEVAVRKDKKKKRRDWITHEQWKKLYAELPSHLRAPAEFAVQTGLRQANVLGLKWDHVDLNRCVVWVDADETKGDEALTVPLNNTARLILSAQDCTHKHVFLYANRDQAITEVKTAWQSACIRAGLGKTNAEGHYEGFTWHGLRHTWATWHVQNGTPLDVLQKLGGWKDLRMVTNYAHHAPSYLASYAGNTEKKG